MLQKASFRQIYFAPARFRTRWLPACSVNTQV